MYDKETEKMGDWTMKGLKNAGFKKAAAAVLCAALAGTVLSGCGEQTVQADPVTITVWTYYNGAQLDSFNQLVEEFNETEGKAQGITVESYSQGSVNDLESNVRSAADGKVGAEPLPNIFSAYADTAQYLDKLDLLVNLKDYLTDEECAEYVAGYLAEGDIDGNGSLKILPVAKSTELLFLNDTDYQTFAQATGTDYSELETVEGLIRVAERYYQWTDAQTEEPDDGRAFFGRDAMANYLFIGAKELGDTIFSVDADGKMTVTLQEATARKLWDSYYVPFIKGYFSMAGRFRSDDVKTGNILAYVGSSSSASFFPASATINDTDTHDIALRVLPCPSFEGRPKYSVQQGAGMAVTRKSEAEIRASVLFLKWFTSPEHNIAFAVNSGYLPVTTAANDLEVVRSSGAELTDNVNSILQAAFDAVQNTELYTPSAFSKGKEARSVLEYTLCDLAAQDRETVEARMEQGMSREAAMADFLSDASFAAWYQDLMGQLKAFEG